MKKKQKIKELEQQVEYFRTIRRMDELVGKDMLRKDCDFLIKEIENLIIYGMEKGYVASYDIQLHPFFTHKPVEVKGRQVNDDK
jgi:hypothetical protein